MEAEERLAIGLANQLAPNGSSLKTSLALVQNLARFPLACMRADRLAAMRWWSLDPAEALVGEWRTHFVRWAQWALHPSRRKRPFGNFGEI